MRMLARELFPAIRDDNIRSQILERLCSIKHVIITIHTFLEDTKYLEPCTRILKKLLPRKSKGSLSQYFNALHSGQPNVKVQTTEFSLEDRTFSGSHASWVAYRVLWLLTLRHFPVMDGQAPRKDIGKQNTWQPGLQYQWWVELSALAIDNGYKRIRLLYRDHKAADISIIEDCVRRLRPSNYYKIDQELIRRKVQLIYQIIGDIAHLETVTTAPELTSDHGNGRLDISDRCGRPRASTLQADENYLFFDHIYSTSYDTTPKRYLTSFAVTRDFFHSFFGTAEDDLDRPSPFRLPRDVHTGDREASSRTQDAEDREESPVNRSSTPPAEVISLDSTRPVENAQGATALFVIPPIRNLRSSDGSRRLIRRGRSASPTTHSHRLGRQRERSDSRSRQRRQDLTSARGWESRRRDSIFPGAVQQLPPAVPSAESTQAATASSVTSPRQRSRSLIQRHRGRSASPTTPSHRSKRQRERSSSYQRERHRRRSSGSHVEDTPAEDMEIVPWVPSSTRPLEKNMQTTIAPRSRSLQGRRKISPRGRSVSPTSPLYRSERRRERSTSSQREKRRRRDAGDSRVEDTSAEEMEMALSPPAVTGSLVESSHSVITPPVSSFPTNQPSAAPMFMFGQEQEIEDRTISFQDATRFLFRRRTRTRSRAFAVISPAGNDRFHIRQVDSTDTVSMVNALHLSSKTPSLALARDQGKRLKLNAPATILDEARSQRLDTALVISNHNAGEIIRQFEDAQESEDELRHKEPYQPTGLELIKVNGKPIRILIWDDGKWKIADKNVIEARTEERIEYYMWRYRGLRPYDWEGHALSAKECFNAAQSDYPEAVYLCHPDEAGSILPIDL